MRRISFEGSAFDEFVEWSKTDRKIYERIVNLIADTLRHPFTGIGKPEPLRSELHGYWSRRITNVHRLVYKVTNEAVIIASCRYHYE